MKIRIFKSQVEFVNTGFKITTKCILLFNTWDYQDIHLVDTDRRWIYKNNIFLESKDGELSRG